VRVCPLASGSKGNSIFVEAGGTRLLIDAGLAASAIVQRLSDIGIDPCSIDALLVTHEHTDHVRGAGAFARRHRVPLIASCITTRAIPAHLKQVDVVEFESGCSFAFRDLLIDPFPLTHDAADPVGFVLQSNEGRIGIATDLGTVTRLVREKLRGCSLLVLESNHDEEMLLNGPYPWHLKQRIRSRHGHISNNESLELLFDLAHDGLEALVLAHLSEVNNHPDKVAQSATAFLAGQSACAPRIVIGEQHTPGPMLEL
jgi:phosphoribosyl 1,2-cyclic phosphodiesterase